MIVWLDAIVQGLLLGAMYGLFATGLSLVFGVMRLVNVAHGDLILLAAFMCMPIQKLTGISSPFLVLILLVPIACILGYGLQRFVLNRTLGQDVLRPVLVTFGISVVIQNALLEGFSADPQRLQAGAIETASIPIVDGIAVGVFPLAVLGVCIAVICALQWLLYHTALGRQFRATSDDGATAALVGVREPHVNALAMAVAFAVIAIAGMLSGIRTSFDPSSGPENLLFAFEAVIMGGLGSLWGTLAGGAMLGVAQTLGARVSPDWQVLAGHLVFLAVLVFRPQGLNPRRVD